jgi:hypothetical protein
MRIFAQVEPVAFTEMGLKPCRSEAAHTLGGSFNNQQRTGVEDKRHQRTEHEVTYSSEAGGLSLSKPSPNASRRGLPDEPGGQNAANSSERVR